MTPSVLLLLPVALLLLLPVTLFFPRNRNCAKESAVALIVAWAVTDPSNVEFIDTSPVVGAVDDGMIVGALVEGADEEYRVGYCVGWT